MKRKLNINIKTFVDSLYTMPVTMHTSFHIQPVEMPRSVKGYKIRIIHQSREALYFNTTRKYEKAGLWN